MLEKFVLLIKSYKADYKRLCKLLTSIETYNVDKLPVYVAVNDNDSDFFRSQLHFNIQLIKDSDIIVCNIKDGWRYQQVVKAQFHLLNICENYLCLDSDSEFIRPFCMDDFMYDEDTPYTVMHESKSFFDTCELIGYDSKNLFQHNALKSVRQRFGTHGKHWDYGPCPYIWSTKVWRHFHEHFLCAQGYTFESFFNEMELSALPSEAVFYGEYLLKTRLIDIIPVEGLFKVYHYKEQFAFEENHFDIERLKINYMGVVMQSNWATKAKSRFAFWK